MGECLPSVAEYFDVSILICSKIFHSRSSIRPHLFKNFPQPFIRSTSSVHKLSSAVQPFRLSPRYCLPHANYENISTFLHFVLNFLPSPRASWHTITTEDWLFHFLSKLTFFSWRWFQETRVNKRSTFQVVPDFRPFPLHTNRLL